MSSQKSVVEEAFASIDVEKEFVEAKNAIIQAHEKKKLDKIQQNPEDLPGWVCPLSFPFLLKFMRMFSDLSFSLLLLARCLFCRELGLERE